jgi:hypothetical protein
MHNPNFLPQRFIDKYASKYVLRYKVVFLALWLGCTGLFLLFKVNYDKYKDLRLMPKVHMSKKEVVASSNKKNLQSIMSFKIFVESLEKSMPYESVEINEKQIKLNLTAKDRDEFIKIIDFVENKIGCKIIFLSPVNNEMEENRFQLIVEK